METLAMSGRPALSSSIPDELIYEILLKLPVTSLLRFKCVCKSWKTLISNPQFAMEHLHTDTITPRRRQLLASFVNDGQNEILTCSVKSLFENPSTPAAITSFQMDRKYSIIGSINGLLCLRDESSGCFRLWNPCTRFESKTSPPIILFRTYDTSVGFGYDQVNNKYKVVVIAEDCSLNVKVTEVHTFGTDSWVTLDDSRTRIKNFPMTHYHELGKFVSGTLNWLNWLTRWTPCMILSFDMENEIYGEVPLPPYVEVCDFRFNFYGLDILNNCLCLYHHSPQDYWVVWLMKKYGVKESWTKLVVIPLSVGNHLYPFRILENGFVLTIDLGSQFFRYYDRNNGKLHNVAILERFGMYMQVYHESLVSP